jgi:3-deoxy-D-arabino-heptulosonate 7-phosphate (DAHP) synthase
MNFAMSKYLDEVFDGLATIEAQTQEISRLARAFNAIHQYDLASELVDIAHYLASASKQIQGAVSEEITINVRDAEAQISGVLMAALRRDGTQA